MKTKAEIREKIKELEALALGASSEKVVSKAILTMSSSWLRWALGEDEMKKLKKREL